MFFAENDFTVSDEAPNALGWIEDNFEQSVEKILDKLANNKTVEFWIWESRIFKRRISFEIRTLKT